MTNFEYYTKDRAVLAMMIDQFMTKPAKCHFCVHRDNPSCPVNAKCLQNIMRWLAKEHTTETRI